MSQYKLVTYVAPQGPRAGLVVGETIIDAAAATGRPDYATMLDVLEDWPNARGLLAATAGKPAAESAQPLAAVKLLPPIPDPLGHLLRRRQLHRPHDGDGEGAEPRARAGSS